MKDYNDFMHGNDRADQMRRSFSIQIRAKKWWKPLFNFIFDSACINAYLLYRQQYGDELTRKMFMILLCKWMCKIDENDQFDIFDEKNDINQVPTINYIDGLNNKMK